MSLGALVTTGLAEAANGRAARGGSRTLDLIDAPTNLGLRPNPHGDLVGTAKATAALRQAGMGDVLKFRNDWKIARREYAREAQFGTRIRNGQSLRAFNLELAERVTNSIRTGGFPLILGGDCSNLLGALLGLRRAGGRGLIDLDGHSDFYHPGNYDSATRLGSAAGMDLALATGRGEAILTTWPGIDGPLVTDADVVQIGERERDEPDYPFHEIASTEIAQVTVQEAIRGGIESTVAFASARLRARKLEKVWLHIDADVLDQSVMPAVDSPGSPGFSYSQLEQLIAGLLETGRVAGADLSIYDPDLDPNLEYARGLVKCLRVFAS